MAWKDLLFDGSEKRDSTDEELDILLDKINNIGNSDEDGNQKELIELCDSAIKLATSCNPEDTELFNVLYWKAGYAYLELAEENDKLLDKAVAYFENCADDTPQWHLAMGRVSFYKENFKEAIRQLQICEKMIKKSFSDKSLDAETAEILSQLCLCGLIRSYYANGDRDKFKRSLSKYMLVIKSVDMLQEFSFIQVVDLLVSVSKDIKELETLLQFITPETTLLEMAGTEYLLKSQISFLDGRIEESNAYAYKSKRQMIDTMDDLDGSGESFWLKELKDELNISFAANGFNCKSFASVETTMALTEARSNQYVNSNKENLVHQKENLICFKCNHPLKATEKFCSECGTEIKKSTACNNCGNELKDSHKFCPNCGTKR